jgi:hypothetical protein
MSSVGDVAQALAAKGAPDVDRDAVRNAVERALAGDVDALAAISSAPQEELVAAVGDRTLTLGAQAVRLVLRGVGSGEIDAPDAQRWASFMQLGHFRWRAPTPSTLIDGEPPTAAEIHCS